MYTVYIYDVYYNILRIYIDYSQKATYMYIYEIQCIYIR